MGSLTHYSTVLHACIYARSGGKYHLLLLTFMLAMISTIVALFLPETINDPLPDTVNDIRFNTGKNDLGDCCSCISYEEGGPPTHLSRDVLLIYHKRAQIINPCFCL